MSKVIEKMNVYLITKDNVKPLVKEGRWFNDLFLPLFKSNKDPLKKQPQLNDYWNEIRDVLLGKKKNSNLKVIKNKDMKFIAFNVANNQILAFVSGTDKKEELGKIYELTQLKGDKFTYEKYLSINKAKDTAAMKWSYDNLFNISEKDIKDWGYKNVEDMVKKNVGRADNDIDSPYCNNKKIGTYVEMSNWGIKEWSKFLISNICKSSKSYDTNLSETEYGEELVNKELKFYVKDANGYSNNTYFDIMLESYGNKESNDKIDIIFKIIGTYFRKNFNKVSNKANKSSKNLCIETAINWIGEHDQAWEDFLPVCQFDNNNLEMDEEKAMYKAISEGKIDLAFIVNWISEHNTLYKDFKNYFGLSEEDIEEITSKNNFEGTGMSEEDIHNLSNEDMEKLGVNDDQFYKFKVYLYQNSNDFEPFSEYKKLEHHFEWLIGDDFKETYRNIKVIDHITNQDDPVLIIEGEVAGISKDDFFEDLIAGADENYNLSDGDIVEWKKV